ncbi:MAG: nucleoside deaminase [Cryomorphaceae bacterium]|nr:nucleoside deaminase [Cryomorphaceae bacterium]
MVKTHEDWLKLTLNMASENVKNGGGPFACIIVKNNSAVATGVNNVVKNSDPTAHAEVEAIRAACRVLGSHQLDECIVYCSCEPCPMCLGAIFWSRPKAVYFAAGSEDAAKIGFDDAVIYREISLAPKKRFIPFTQISDEDRITPFQTWERYEGRKAY